MSVLTIESAKKLQPNPYVLAEAKMKYTDSEYQDLIRRTDKSVKEKPAKEFGIKVLVTREPQDFWHMYSNGPHSCMMYPNARSTYAWMEQYKLHPNSSLVYDQFTRGIYIKDDKDKTLFRIIACSNKEIDGSVDKLKWTYGAYYTFDSGRGGTSPEHQAVIKFLDALNIKTGKFNNKYTAKYQPISILLNKKQTQIMTMPYFDDKSYAGALNWDGKAFIVNYGSSSETFSKAKSWSCGSCFYRNRNDYSPIAGKNKYRRSISEIDMQTLGLAK